MGQPKSIKTIFFQLFYFKNAKMMLFCKKKKQKTKNKKKVKQDFDRVM
jgi:hypothetical protein